MESGSWRVHALEYRIEMSILATQDPKVADALRNEERRQREVINLIASENYASAAVLEAQGSVFTNKYAEGLPRKALLRRLRMG